MLACLLENPHELELARAAVQSENGGYNRLTAAFNETLRLWPPVRSNGKMKFLVFFCFHFSLFQVFRCQRDGEILGQPVKTNDTIVISNFIAHRDKKVYGDNPEEFHSDRFLVSSKELKENADAVKLVPQLGFSFGQHQCLGKLLVYKEMCPAISMILKRYDFEFGRPGYKAGYAEDRHLIAHPNEGLPLKIKRRRE
jgi:cytochrome P450